jgi:hypothetical protein
MNDFALSYITIQALLKRYQEMVLKNDYTEAANIAVDIQLLAVDLQTWAEIKENGNKG